MTARGKQQFQEIFQKLPVSSAARPLKQGGYCTAGVPESPQPGSTEDVHRVPDERFHSERGAQKEQERLSIFKS